MQILEMATLAGSLDTALASSLAHSAVLRSNQRMEYNKNHRAMQSVVHCLLLCGPLLLPLLAHAAWDTIEPDAADCSGNTTCPLSVHQRQKRHQLIFANGGTIRLVISPVFPISLGDKVPWRGLLFFYALHCGQYTLPSAPLYPWDKWEEIYARSLQRQISMLNGSQRDDTRLFAYAALEHYINRQVGRGEGASLGRQCLLRAICENAQVARHIGLLAELLHILLSPGKAHVDAVYTDAQAAGRAGVDCLAQYSSCPRGRSIFDGFALDY